MHQTAREREVQCTEQSGVQCTERSEVQGTERRKVQCTEGEERCNAPEEERCNAPKEERCNAPRGERCNAPRERRRERRRRREAQCAEREGNGRSKSGTHRKGDFSAARPESGSDGGESTFREKYLLCPPYLAEDRPCLTLGRVGVSRHVRVADRR